MSNKKRAYYQQPWWKGKTHIMDLQAPMAIGIEEVHDGETVYTSVDMNDKEKIEFLESFNMEQFEKLTEFFDTMPKIRHYVKVKNPKTKVESDVLIEGLESFLV